MGRQSNPHIGWQLLVIPVSKELSETTVLFFKCNIKLNVHMNLIGSVKKDTTGPKWSRFSKTHVTKLRLNT